MLRHEGGFHRDGSRQQTCGRLRGDTQHRRLARTDREGLLGREVSCLLVHCLRLQLFPLQSNRAIRMGYRLTRRSSWGIPLLRQGQAAVPGRRFVSVKFLVWLGS